MSHNSSAVDTDPVRRFFSACNCPFSNCFSANEIVQFTSQDSHRFPVLTFALPAINFKSKQLSDLNACYKSVFRKIPGFNKWDL